MKLLFKIFYAGFFIFFYMYDVILSNISIAADILTPKHRMEPAIVDVKLHTTKENEILAISNLISMTPGSLALDYNREKNTLTVHVMYYNDPEKFRRVTDQLQARIN
ncbi:MAG: Na+/H+ antiporter subunit E, partial [Bacteroidales bacterium]|nr:Na+/H+ antiporter subunit E [Bacteroidales bacterium]